MQDPHVDCEMRLGPSPDLMALPGVPEAVKLAIKVSHGLLAASSWRGLRASLPGRGHLGPHLPVARNSVVGLPHCPASCRRQLLPGMFTLDRSLCVHPWPSVTRAPPAIFPSISILAPVCLALQMFVGSQLGYPNQLLVPLMPNFGMPPEPEGMLSVQASGRLWFLPSLVSRVSRRLWAASSQPFPPPFPPFF